MFSDVGVLKDAHVDEARSLLSHLYDRRRVNAFDSLLLPPLDKPELLDANHRRAARLSTFSVDFVLENLEPSQTSLRWALLQRGIPASMLGKLERSVLSVDNQLFYTRALFGRRRTYWRMSDFAARSSPTSKAAPVRLRSGKQP